jgi:RNA-directed DNA polymerase
MHPEKTRIVYCKDVNRKGEYEHIQFGFLGYTFGPGRSCGKSGRIVTRFTPAIARSAAKALRQEVRSWRLQAKSDKSLEDLSRTFNRVIAGWVNDDSRFYASAFHA